MNSLPETEDALVLRTDFSDQDAWEDICTAIRPTDADGNEPIAYVEFHDDPAYQGLSSQQLLALVPEDYGHSFLAVVDKAAIDSDEQPVLIIDLDEERGREFRVIASELHQIENNLSIANMDFAEFSDAADDDGIFRGF